MIPVNSLPQSSASSLSMLEFAQQNHARSQPADWSVAIEALRAALPAESVFSDSATRHEYSRCTLPTKTMPGCVVFPSCREDVQRVMQILGQYELPWHAISCGKNWGYGDACASTDGQVIIDLRRMNKIVEVNEDLAYAVIEPGVTQSQLANYLTTSGSRLMLDVTGAGPDASVVGNTLQRGFGHTPYGDHFAHSCNYEVVLPNGSLINTGFGAIEQSNVGHVYAYGLGPFTQGCFTQSHAGIVTRMTVWLMPRPERIVGFGFKVRDASAISSVMDALRELRQNDVVRSIVHVANDMRVISTQLPNCWQESEGSCLSRQQRENFARDCGVGAWNAVGGLYGTHGAVREAMRATRKAFQGVAQVHFFSRKKVDFLEKTLWLASRFELGRQWLRIVDSVHDILDLLEGIPTAKHLNGARWRSGNDNADLRDMGLIWVAPVIPLCPEDVKKAIAIIEETFETYLFDPLITISPISPRAAICIANVNFNKHNSLEAQKAIACSQATKAKLLANGYSSYRTSSIDISSTGTNPNS